MLKTIWGKLCGPHGVCLGVLVAQLVLSFSVLLSVLLQCPGRSRISGFVACLRIFVMHCSHDLRLWVLYFDEDTLICTLLSVCWLYFDEDTLIQPLVSVRWLYFDEDTQICTLRIMHHSRDSIPLFCAVDESILLGMGEGMSEF